jgi:hypothetical protein
MLAIATVLSVFKPQGRTRGGADAPALFHTNRPIAWRGLSRPFGCP